MKAFLWGRTRQVRELDAAAAERLCDEAFARREAAAARPLWKTLAILERAGRLWEDPSAPWRRRAQSVMPRVSGFSGPMVRRTLDILPRLLERAALRRRVEAELRRDDALERWRLEAGYTTAVRAYPLGSVLHVAAGNVFLGAVDSLVMSLLTNNVTILRLSSADAEFPFLFAGTLLKADPDRELAGTLAIVGFGKEREDVARVFKRRMQGIVLWGGEEAVSAWRKDLGAGTKLIAFGPKLSFGVVTRRGLDELGAREAARRAAADIACWDQAACASPQTLFVQHPRPDEFLRALAAELGREGKRLPPGKLSPDDAAAVLEERHRILAAELEGEGRLLAPRDMGWTVAWRRQPGLRASPLSRFIQVCPFKDRRHLVELIAPSAAYLQSAGLLACGAERAEYAGALASAGLARIPELGRMLESEDGAPHDGRYALGELVRWVSGPAEAAMADAPQALASLMGQAAAESPFYRKQLRGKPLPLLDKSHLYENAPPRSDAILTRAGEGKGSLIFATGGSTGQPKFSLYTEEEFEETCRWLAYSMRQAGLKSGDKVANLFVAGNLWSSFLAISGAARALDCAHLPLGGTAEPEYILDSIRRFRASVLIGLPTTLLELARRAEASKRPAGLERRRLKVEKIFYGGEHVSAEMEAALKRAFGARLVRSAGYASVDAGLVGFQCGACEGTAHHAAAGLQHVEILRPNGRPAGRGETGEIIATNLLRRWMPVIRYRTGDLGRWLPGPCPCGHPAPRFVLLGRCDDRINVGGAHLDVGDVGRAVASVPGLSLAYQVVVSAEGGERLTVKVERKAGGASPGTLAKKLSRALLAESEELSDSVSRGWLPAPAVDIIPPGALPRQPRTGKLRRVVDLRR